MITVDLLQKLCPNTKHDTLAKFVDALNTECANYSINIPQRMAGFLAQVAHESGDFNFVKENLNYSADGLQKIFHNYFPDADTANAYARNPQKIANKVYASRMGNGDEASGDGYKFCGRGLIQLTGKDNYSKFAASLGKSLDDTVAFLETTEGAVASAAWFWNTHGLNDIADKGDIVTMTKRINGGTIGLDDRTAKYNAALAILQG